MAPDAGFEPATTRPPDAYSNRAELHPELRVQKYGFSANWQIFSRFFFKKMQLSSQNPQYKVDLHYLCIK